MPQIIELPRLVVAGAASGVGKTTISLGLVRALTDAGDAVSPFRVGSDVVAAAELSHAARRSCRSLSGSGVGAPGLRRALASGARDAGYAVIDGAAGIFDSPVWGGVAGGALEGTTAEVAVALRAPVVVVVDASTTAETAAAIALGIRSLDPRLNVAGIILNRVTGERLRSRIEDAVWNLATVPVLGALPDMPELARPVGGGGRRLRIAGEQADRLLDAAAQAVRRHCDLDLLLALMRRAPALELPDAATAAPPGTRVRLAVAYDDAFCLNEPENLELLAEAGAEIVPVSPLEDRGLPRDIDAVYIAGAVADGRWERLAHNHGFCESLRRAADHGVPIYADGGGAAYMARRILVDGAELDLCGIIPAHVRVDAVLEHPRARKLTLASDGLLGDAGAPLFGLDVQPIEVVRCERRPNAYTVHDCDDEALGFDGWHGPALLASSIHLQLGHNPDLARRIVRAMAGARRHPIAVGVGAPPV